MINEEKKKGVKTMNIIYLLAFFIIMLSSSIAGIGGGVVLKPVLDFIGFYTTIEVAVISAIAILTMGIVSVTIKLRKKEEDLNVKLLLTISISSIVGSVISSSILSSVTNMNTVEIVQSILLIILIIALLIITNLVSKTYEIKNNYIIFLIGVVLGALPTFIGVGGGFLNVPIFTKLFNIKHKKAALYSLSLVIFSQLTKLIILSMNTNLLTLQYKLLPQILIGSVLGGVVGSKVVNKFGDNVIKVFYNIIVAFVLMLTVYNLVN